MADRLRFDLAFQAVGVGKTAAEIRDIQRAIAETAETGRRFGDLAGVLGVSAGAAKKFTEILDLSPDLVVRLIGSLRALNREGFIPSVRFATVSEGLELTIKQFRDLDRLARGLNKLAGPDLKLRTYN